MAHDIALENGDLPLVTRRISGTELIAQRIRIRLRTFLGEWLLDRRVGLPFLRWRERRAPPLASIASRVSEEVRTTRGVLEVRRVRAVQDGEVVRVSGEVVVEGGELLTLSVELGGEGNTSPAVAMALAKSGAIL